MKKLILLAVVLLLLIGCNGKMSEKEIAKAKENAMQLLADGDYAAAVEALNALLEYDDDDQTIAVALVDAYVGLEDYDKAIKVLDGIKWSEEVKKDKILQYSIAKYLQGIATVDFAKLKDLSVDYLQHFNDKYILFRSEDKYGLLDRKYDVVLQAKYSGIFIGVGPFDGKIMVYKNDKHAKNHDYSNAVILDKNLNETNKKGSGFGIEDISGYMVESKVKNKLIYVDWVDDGDGGVDIDVSNVTNIDDDMVVPGGKLEADFGAYSYTGKHYLVKASDLSIHQLDGVAVRYDMLKSPIEIFDEMVPVFNKNKKCGYYNLNVLNVSPFVYDILPYKFSQECNDFSKGYAAVRSDAKYGMIDKQGELVVPLEFDSITTIVNDEFLILYQGRIGVCRLK